MEKQVILINGPSSSGKSTLARTLVKLIREKSGEKYGIVSIDDFMKTDPNETIYEDDVYEISGEMCEKAIGILETGAGVIVDHVITSERIYKEFQDALRSFTIRTVHVTCALEILKQRERNRKDRCIGSAESSFIYLYPKEGYDLTVDTASQSAGENALKIFERMFL